MKRWIVRLPAGGMDDVGADLCEFHKSGALVFYRKVGGPYADDELVYAYAPGRWWAVEPE